MIDILYVRSRPIVCYVKLDSYCEERRKENDIIQSLSKLWYCLSMGYVGRGSHEDNNNECVITAQ